MDELKENSGWNKQGGARKLYTCHKFDCDYSTFDKSPKCPECGFPLYDAETFKLFGVILMVCGLFLTAIGGGLLLHVSLRAGRDVEMKYVIYGIFVVLILMGLALLTAGIQQSVTGLKSTSFTHLFLVLLAIAGVLGAIIKFVATLT